MLRRRVLWLGSSLLALSAAAEEPGWLKDARAREGKLEKTRSIRSTDNFFYAKVPAKVSGKIRPDDGAYVVRMDAGAGATIDCVILRDRPDLASFLATTTKALYEAIDAGPGKVEAKTVDRVDAGAIGSTPFLAIDWTHRIVGEDGKAAIGGLKQIAASKDGHGIYCGHDEVGYSKTFRSLASALVETIQFADAPPERPYRTEISTIAVQGMRVAVDAVTYALDEDGDTVTQHMSSLLMPVDVSTLMTSDSVTLQWVRPDGSLINAFTAENVNGQLETELRLDADGEGGWKVRGKFKTKPLETTITAGDPSTMLRDTHLLRARLSQPTPTGAKIRVQTWSPDVDPSKLLEQEIAILRSLEGGRFAAKVTMHGVGADVVVDREGSVVSGSLTMGPAKMEIERIFVEGEIPAPAKGEVVSQRLP